MADHFLAALGCARRALARPADPAADAHLLDRFVRDRDEGAFAELVARHGPVVWTACRRGAATAADAEDAFQATFLVLARRAGRVRRAAAVSGWLFRVAVRLAARTRARAARPVGPVRPAADPTPDPADRAAWQDLVAVLDAELAALPDAVRAALVCCYYEGLTQDEAARRLGWKVRTLRARVGRGRTILRTRLARRGVDLGAALAAAAVGTATAAPPAMGPVLPADGSIVGPPAVAALVRDGLALTGRALPLRLAVGAVVVVAAGVGYALVVGPGPAPAGGRSGSPPADAPPAGVAQPPAHPKAAVDAVAVYNRAVDGCVYVVRETDGRTVEGTGALIDRDRRLVLTTCRVVGDSDVVSVQFPYHNLSDETVETDRTDYARSAAAKLTPMGRVIRRDKARDLALVQLDRLGRHARALELAEAGVRQAVLHIGSGTGPLFSMAVRKVVPGDAPAVDGPVNWAADPVRAPRVTLSGTTDDSGGPLVDRDGKLVGVVAGAERNITRAIDIPEVRAFLASKNNDIPTPPADPIVKKLDPPAITFPDDLGPHVGPLPEDVGPPDPPLPGDFDAAELYTRGVKSTVFIVTPLKDGISMGSGSLIDAEKRYVLTNYHVVGEGDSVYVQFPVRNKDGGLMTDKKKYMERIPAGQALRGKVLHRDQSRDLALVQLDKLPPDARALPLAKKSVRVGERVIHIGNPGKVDSTFSTTDGVVRAVGVMDFVVNGSDGARRIKARMVNLTNPIDHGDSGGPIIDRRGYLVGVTESGTVDGRTQNVNYGIDVAEVWAFLKEKKVTIKDLTGEKAEPKKDPKSENPPPATGTENPPKADRPPGEGGGAAPAPAAEDERMARLMLSRARLFAEGDDDRATYIAKLKDVINKYPGTQAARDAKKLLDRLK
jgi:RNA polymerase sigma factor (sigma-70 family)